MRIIRYGLIWIVVLVIVAACSNDGGEESAADATPTVRPTATATVDPSTPTPPPTFPPTWTPVPSLTAAPAQPTIQYTYVRPTATPLILPSYTPSPIPPTPTPPGPVLIITADMLNQAVRQELEAGSGGLYAEPPNIGFQDGVMVISINVLDTPGDMTTARAVTIQATVDAVEGRVQVNKVRAFYADTNAIYDTDLEENILQTVQQKLSALIVEAYGGGQDARFSVAEVLVADAGITIQTVAIPQ
jgi:hypothetical protein